MISSIQRGSGKRVVIVDDSRTMQVIMEQIFSTRLGFDVVGIASDAESGARMVRATQPDIVSIDLCMPYIDGGDLLLRLNDLPGTCKIIISAHGLDNRAVVHRLQSMGAHACITKRDIMADPARFNRNVQTALMKAKQAAPSKRSNATKSVSSSQAPYAIPQFDARDEQARIEALSAFNLANDDPDHRLDLLTEHLRSVTGFSSAMLTFVDRDTAWIKSAAGFPRGANPRAIAFCSHTICAAEPLIVSNTTLDPRFAAHPFVTGEPGVRTYVGVPITSAAGVVLGSACLMDLKPRKITEAILANLKSVSAIAGVMIDASPPRSLAA